MKRLCLAIIALTLSGCGATMVATRGGSPSANAPINEGKGGTIRYYTNSMSKSDREDAYRQMKKFCNGPYTITSETINSRASGGVVIPNQFGAVYSGGSQQYVYLNFECETKP